MEVAQTQEEGTDSVMSEFVESATREHFRVGRVVTKDDGSSYLWLSADKHEHKDEAQGRALELNLLLLESWGGLDRSQPINDATVRFILDRADIEAFDIYRERVATTLTLEG